MRMAPRKALAMPDSWNLHRCSRHSHRGCPFFACQSPKPLILKTTPDLLKVRHRSRCLLRRHSSPPDHCFRQSCPAQLLNATPNRFIVNALRLRRLSRHR